jgi:5-methylcytosine-specific restriction endonuclease McrA
MKIISLTKEDIIGLMKKYSNINQILISLDVNSNGSGAYKTFKAHCSNLGVSLEGYGKFSSGGFQKKIPIEEILVENSTYANNVSLKKRLIREGVLDYKCVECGNIGKWNEKPLVLQLDHINGINTDNRIENLRILCPNCHSQTKTFCRGGSFIKKKTQKKNGKCHDCKIPIYSSAKRCIVCHKKYVKSKSKKPQLEELIENIELKGYLQAGKIYGVSDNTIRKWIKSYGLNPKEIKKK